MIEILNGFAESDPLRRGGTPVLKGTRFPLFQFLGELADGRCIDEIADDLNLEIETLRGILNALADAYSDDKWRASHGSEESTG